MSDERMPDQRSVTDQLEDLIAIATQRKMYDAVDWIRARAGHVRTCSCLPDDPCDWHRQLLSVIQTDPSKP